MIHILVCVFGMTGGSLGTELHARVSAAEYAKYQQLYSMNTILDESNYTEYEHEYLDILCTDKFSNEPTLAYLK